MSPQISLSVREANAVIAITNRAHAASLFEQRAYDNCGSPKPLTNDRYGLVA